MSDFALLRKLNTQIAHSEIPGARLIAESFQRMRWILLGHRIQLLQLEARIDVLEKERR